MKFMNIVITVILLTSSPALAEKVLILSTGNRAFDNQLVATLENDHEITLGPPYHSFVGTGLEGKDVVILAPSYNWYVGANVVGDMPLAGQDALVEFIGLGGGLITSEWTILKWATDRVGFASDIAVSSFVRLGGLFTVHRLSFDPTYPSVRELTYTQATSDTVLNSGMPPSFTFQADYVEGTETYFAPLPNATVFYGSMGSRFRTINNDITPTVPNGAGVVGWRVGAGHVLQFSTIIGPQTIADPLYSRLLSNAIRWAGHENLGPLVSQLRFAPEVCDYAATGGCEGHVKRGDAVTATFIGHQLTPDIYFDIRYTDPFGRAGVAFNWQQGTLAEHIIPITTLPFGAWDVTGIRAHLNRDDHSGDFDPVYMRLLVFP